MKKLIVKDKKRWPLIQKLESDRFVLISIFWNTNFPMLSWWKAFLKLKKIGFFIWEVSFSSWCLKTFNNKKFNHLTFYSRHVFLKLVWFGKISGIKKSVW